MNEEIAIAHNHYPAMGGGELVANELAECFDARIVTAWIDDGETPDGVEVSELIDGVPHESFVRNRVMPNPTFRNYYYKWLWELAPPLRGADVIIQSGGFPSYYVPDDDQLVIQYVHSPPRYPFDRFGDSTKPIDKSVIRHPKNALGLIKDRVTKRLSRGWNKQRMRKGMRWVANSELVKYRTHLYYNVPLDDIDVVYPPVDVQQFTATDDHDGYYLALSRLEPAKRMDMVIDAFRELNQSGDYPLRIAGDGNAREELEEQADGCDAITFEGYVSEQRKLELMENAKASVFAAVSEDFGIVPIENMAAATPVIGIKDGFTQHQIVDGKSGILFDSGVSELAETVRRFDSQGVVWSAGEFEHYTEQFGVGRFREEMRAIVNETVDEKRPENHINVPELVTQ